MLPPTASHDNLQDRIATLEADVARLQAENDALCKSEMDLASERNKFADLYDFAPLGYVILTPDGEVKEANLFAATLVGMERTQFLGQKFVQFIHTEHHGEFETFLRQTSGSAMPVTCELKFSAKSDHVRYVALQKRHVREANDDTRIYLTLIDITSRKLIEAERGQLLAEKETALGELERTLAMLDALFEEAPVGLAFLDDSLRLQRHNRALTEILGLSGDEHLGKTPQELLPDLTQEATVQQFEEVQRTGKPVQFQLERHSHYWWTVYYPIHIRKLLWGIGVIVIENTAEKLAEAALRVSHEELRISEERFRAALQDSSITIFNQDRDLRYTWIHNNLVLDQSVDSTGKTDHELWPPELADNLTTLKQQVLETGEEVREEIQVTTPDAADRYFDLRIAPRYGPSGEVIGIIGVSFDLTKEKETDLEVSRQRILAESLASAVNAVHGSANLSEVLDFILSSMANVIPHDLADIMLIDEDHVHVARSRGYSQHQLSTTVLPIDQPTKAIPLLAEMLTTRQALLIPDLQSHIADEPLITVDWLRGFVGVPLLWQHRVIGFINLMSTKADFFTTQHAEKLRIFAAQAALAIRNAQLNEDSQQAAVLQERQRLARDLHDAVSQSLYTSNIIAESLQFLYKSDPSKVPEQLETLHILNRGALAEMRTLLLELRPEKLDATSMKDLLQQLADAARARTGLSAKVIVKSETEIPTDIKEAFYRITQEALTNIIKHANASHVHVRYANRKGRVKLVIEDDGQGFDIVASADGRMGISNMKERMAAYGGTVEIDSEIGGGTVVTATWAG